MAVLVALLLLAAIVGIGGLIKGLFWLVSVGVILFIVILAIGVSRVRTSS